MPSGYTSPSTNTSTAPTYAFVTPDYTNYTDASAYATVDGVENPGYRLNLREGRYCEPTLSSSTRRDSVYSELHLGAAFITTPYMELKRTSPDTKQEPKIILGMSKFYDVPDVPDGLISPNVYDDALSSGALAKSNNVYDNVLQVVGDTDIPARPTKSRASNATIRNKPTNTYVNTDDATTIPSRVMATTTYAVPATLIFSNAYDPVLISTNPTASYSTVKSNNVYDEVLQVSGDIVSPPRPPKSRGSNDTIRVRRSVPAVPEETPPPVPPKLRTMSISHSGFDAAEELV